MRGGNRCADPPPWGHRAILKRVMELSGVVDSSERTKHCQLPDGNGRAPLARCQMLSCVARCLHLVVHCGGHRPETLGRESPCRWELQHISGGPRWKITQQYHHYSYGDRGFGGNGGSLLPCNLHWKRYGKTWSMLHCSQEVRYWTEYILRKDLRLF